MEERKTQMKHIVFSCSLQEIQDQNIYENQAAIIDTKEAEDRLDDLLNEKSSLFKSQKWKVFFSDAFKTSFGTLTSPLKRDVLKLLIKLSTGWRPKHKAATQMVEGEKHVVWSVDVIKDFNYMQVIEIWDILRSEEVPKLNERLECIFSNCTDDYISRCSERLREGNRELPVSWPASQQVIKFRSEVIDGGNYVEHSNVSESLTLMKFYTLSRGVARHLLSNDAEVCSLQIKLTDEQTEIIRFPKSSFILGRSGTGKTALLTSKLILNEQNFRVASEGVNEAEESSGFGISDADDSKSTSGFVLRQLFVTLNPKLRFSVKRQLASVSFSGAEAGDVPNTLAKVPLARYPLVLTFQEFLLSLDRTIGSSYFERFNELRGGSLALQSFIRTKEVTFDRFRSNYWPRFNSKLKNKLDPARVFNEITSHIKGGVQTPETILSAEAYRSLADGRRSSLTKERRNHVYSIYQVYENLKTEREEFDWLDVAIDLHRRFRSEPYKGDKMDFVFIDEVQDLSIKQLSLFKYICENVQEGFMFAGDTAQTIARGVDFRFEDIRSTFYKEFLACEKEEKGLVSKIFQLKRNFRTHAGILKLAHSVIELTYYYFPEWVDLLEPERSFVFGEAPVLLEGGKEQDKIMTIFGGHGFGANQVMLVRDEAVKTEMKRRIGKQALILTIPECKGLEFEDVLLYDFFGASPLKHQWRVIYGFMEKHACLEKEFSESFPKFNDAKHSILCAELKQLYVGITRARQRLWILETNDDYHCKPMFYYWKRMGLVQTQEVHDSLKETMRVTSSPGEWCKRGTQFLNENNFDAAIMCFEKAEDTERVIFAKASRLRAEGDRVRGTFPEASIDCVREAARMFESVRKHESAASCYCDLGEYEKAANAYAEGGQFSTCLSACREGKLYDKGLQLVQQWKGQEDVKLSEIKQKFLEDCARDYHGQKDVKSMMKFVGAFCSMESKRVFLRSLDCVGELLYLEEESGNFLEAAELARSLGCDVLKEAELFEKAGHAKEATSLLLWHVFCSSLWGKGNKGWPLRTLVDRNKDICEKAKSLAKTYSDEFYEFVCSELNLLSKDHQSSLLELKKGLEVSQKNKSSRGEIFMTRKILLVCQP